MPERKVFVLLRCWVCILKYTEWEKNDYSQEYVQLFREAGYSPLTANVLAARGYKTADEASRFTHGRTEYHDPMLLKDMDRAVRRIRRAVEQGEKIAVYGDYDVDGITSTCLMVCCIRELGGQCVYYIPERIEEGYGLNCTAVEKLAGEGVRLIVTVDCGVTAVREVERARSLGVDVVVTDHHRCQGTLPDAAAVVNPCREDDTYPFGGLAGVGVAFKLACSLMGDEEAGKYIDYTALGTVADVMPLTDENRTIVKEGIRAINTSPRPGILSLAEESGLDCSAADTTDVAFSLAPRINAAGRMGRVYLATELLLTDDPVRAAELAAELGELNRQRQKIESDILAQAHRMLEGVPDEGAIVLSDRNWHHGVIGIVSSKLAEEYRQRVFLIALSDGVGKASCRSFRGQSVIAAIESASGYLTEYGGHEMAAGFTIAEENIPAFAKAVKEYAREHREEDEAGCRLPIDCVLDGFADVTVGNVGDMDVLKPFGHDNEEPVFVVEAANVEKLFMVGARKDHMKLVFSKGGVSCGGMFFNEDRMSAQVCQGDIVDVAFTLKINEYRNQRTAQMYIQDIRPCAFERSCAEEEEELMSAVDSEAGPTREQACRMLPDRKDFVALWKYLAPRATEALTVSLPVLAREADGMDAVTAAVCLRAFQQSGLIELTGRGRMVSVLVLPFEGKAKLEDTPVMTMLGRAAGAD